MTATTPTDAGTDDDLAAVIRRLQRAQGQLGGIIRMIHCIADPRSGPDPAEMERLFLSLA